MLNEDREIRSCAMKKHIENRIYFLKFFIKCSDLITFSSFNFICLFIIHSFVIVFKIETQTLIISTSPDLSQHNLAFCI